ncbi:hypothetical protein COV17_04000 [Candidatus Woesearchaeota archaeon CG10_big_fil_rev_8_21_14_0_10_36_11]|nr:MAG: hypothetical protein COV17_04000 [Candidatus Woesearchaeota archaeon CG10_big_fil_rev_8_21_14_0_10_36_11]
MAFRGATKYLDEEGGHSRPGEDDWFALGTLYGSTQRIYSGALADQKIPEKREGALETMTRCETFISAMNNLFGKDYTLEK